MDDKLYDVFISYSTEDQASADAIVDSLTRQGLKCWIAPSEIKAGAQWATELDKALRGSRMALVVFSRHADASEWVAEEVSYAHSLRLRYTWVRLDEINPNPPLSLFLLTRQWIKATPPPLEAHLDLVAAAIKGVVDELRQSGGGGEARAPRAEFAGEVAGPEFAPQQPQPSVDESEPTGPEWLDRALAQGPRALDRPAPAVPTLSWKAGTEAVAKCRELAKTGQTDAALAELDRMVTDLVHATDPRRVALRAEALRCLGDALATAGLDHQAFAIYDELIARMVGINEYNALRQLLAGMRGRIAILDKHGRNREVLAAMDQLDVRFEPAHKNTGLAPDLVEVGTQRGLLLLRLGRQDEGRQALLRAVGIGPLVFADRPILNVRAIAYWYLAQIEEQSGHLERAAVFYMAAGDAGRGDPLSKEVLGNGRMRSADLYLELGKFSDAQRQYELFILGHAQTTDPYWRVQLARAMLGQAQSLASQGLRSKAKAAFEQLLKRFRDNRDPRIMPVVSQAQHWLPRLDKLGPLDWLD